MRPLPVIRDTTTDELASNCCPRPGGLKDLQNIHRTLPPRAMRNSDAEVLQDEAGFAILDEITGTSIFDDLRRP